MGGRTFEGGVLAGHYGTTIGLSDRFSFHNLAQQYPRSEVSSVTSTIASQTKFSETIPCVNLTPHTLASKTATRINAVKELYIVPKC